MEIKLCILIIAVRVISIQSCFERMKYMWQKNPHINLGIVFLILIPLLQLYASIHYSMIALRKPSLLVKMKQTRTLARFASKMANYASKPKHESTSAMWSYGDGKTPSQLKISSWNVNGFRSIVKKGLLQSYLLQHNPDILCVNQTKMDLQAFHNEQENLTKELQAVVKPGDVRNWYWYWNFCKVSSGYSGVLTLSRYQPLISFEQFPLDHHMRLQGRCITLQFQKFYLVNCYKPNSGSELQRLEQRTQKYDKCFTQFVRDLKQKKPVIICSDMNVAHKEIDLANPKQNQKNPGFTKQERQSFDSFLREAGLIDSYRVQNPEKVEYTWWSPRAKSRQNNIGWRIDYILLSDPSILRKAQILTQVMGSDHCPVQCTVKI